MTQFEDPFAGWPHWKIISENGGGVHITGRYLNPSLAFALPEAYGLFAFAMVLLALLGSGNIFVAVVVAGFLWAFYSVWKPAMVNMWGKKVDVKVFADMIQVRSKRSYKNYSRAVPIEFRIEPHHRGLEERAKEEQLGRKVKGLYRNAIEVVMQYGEKRIPLAEFNTVDVEFAKAVVFRLQHATMKFTQLKQAANFLQRPANSGDFGPRPQIP